MTSPEAHSFPCSTCGAKLEYDASIQAMRCPYCMSQQAIQVAQAEIREIPIEEGFRRATRGLATPVTAVSCQDCGATVNVGPQDRTVQCTFCGSHKVLPHEADPNLIRPESLVPFQVDREAAIQSFRGWLKGLWFRPSDLKHVATVEHVVGVYIPFWTFDAWIHSSWTADAGHYYYVTETYEVVVNGRTETRTRQVRHTRWVPASGQRSDHYDDELVCASKGVPRDMVAEVATFDTKRLVPYQPHFLAGWRAESYAVDLFAGWEIAQDRIADEQYERCAGDIPGDTYRDLEVNNTAQGVTFKHVLLPLWIATYNYRGKVHRFLVNGQTGKVAGSAPYSVTKIVLFIAAVVAAIVFIAYAFGREPAHAAHALPYEDDSAAAMMPRPTYVPGPTPVQPSQPSPLPTP